MLKQEKKDSVVAELDAMVEDLNKYAPEMDEVRARVEEAAELAKAVVVN